MRGDRRGAQLIRTLRLLRVLDGTWVPLCILEYDLKVTRRTIRRDVVFLRGHGFGIVSRSSAISDSQDTEYQLVRWPAQYDLTKTKAHVGRDADERTA